MSDYSRDLEKNPKEVGVGNVPAHERPSYVYENGAVPGESFEYGNSYYAKAQRFAGKLRIEQRGIERVPEDERTDSGFKALLNVSTMVSTSGNHIIALCTTDMTPVVLCEPRC